MTCQILVFASQKGGSGKTTLTGHTAVQAHLAGAGPVAVIDTDPQRSLAQWHQARSDDDLMLRAVQVDALEACIAEVKERGARTIVIDTPPAATLAISRVVRVADLICIPARPSPHDLRAVGATIEIVESQRKPMVFVLNGAIARARINADAIMSLSQHGTVASTIVHHRVAFATSMADGRSVMETEKSSRSAAEIEALWSYLGDRLRKLAALQAATRQEPAASQEQLRIVPYLDFQRSERTPVARRLFMARRNGIATREFSKRLASKSEAAVAL